MKEQKSNGADKVVKFVRIYASGRVETSNPVGRPPKSWDKGRAHALPDEKPTPTPEPAAKVKDPKKVAAGKARAAKAAQAKADAAAKAAKAKPAAKKPARKAAKEQNGIATVTKGLAAAKKHTARVAKRDAPATPAKRVRNAPGKDAKVVTAFRLSKEHKAKLEKLGGADWLRERLEKAQLPTK